MATKRGLDCCRHAAYTLIHFCIINSADLHIFTLSFHIITHARANIVSKNCGGGGGKADNDKKGGKNMNFTERAIR